MYLLLCSQFLHQVPSPLPPGCLLYASVQSAAAAIEKACPDGVDVLINNAVPSQSVSLS